MERLPMYPMLTKENKFLGLELMDLLLLLVVYLAIFLISRNLLVNLSILLGAYLFLASYKRKKAPRYTQSLVRFLLMPSRYTQFLEECE
jgi:hypothetical protein